MYKNSLKVKKSKYFQNILYKYPLSVMIIYKLKVEDCRKEEKL